MKPIFQYTSIEVNLDTRKSLYFNMLKSRLIEKKMLILLRQGKISKWFSGIGQEAISVGVTMALQADEYILPMHRNLGVFTTRKIPLYRLFSQWQGKSNGFTKGRDRSFHFGTQDYKIIGMISHLGPQLGVADGIALSHVLKNESKLTAVFSGDGGTSEGDFHEALNVASVWNLPVLFCIENNGYGLSTPTSEQYNCKSLADRGVGYGMESHIIEGNNVLEVFSKVDVIAKSVRQNPRPVLIEFKTFRMRGHEEASGTKYVSKELFDLWKKKDPLSNFENYLIETNDITLSDIEKFKISFANEIKEGLQRAFDEPEIIPNLDTELSDVYKYFDYLLSATQATSKKENIRLIDAISEGLRQSMECHSDLVIMGQDIAEYGGVFKITDGFVAEFGVGRVRNTPISEAAPLGAALGLSMMGKKSMVEMQFADFVSCGFNQIANNLAKTYYRWGQNSDVVIRMPTGGGSAAGPFHSQSNEAWFFHIAGLKIVYPSNGADLKGLIKAAYYDPNPVVILEHKGLYWSKVPGTKGATSVEPAEDYILPFGKAWLLQEIWKQEEEETVSIITYGMGVHWAMNASEELGIQDRIEVVDLRTLHPLDYKTVFNSVKKCGKCLVVTEEPSGNSFSRALQGRIQEECFNYLDAPVMIIGSENLPAIPLNSTLEQTMIPSTKKVKEKINVLLDF